MKKITLLLSLGLFVGVTAFAQIQRNTFLEVFTSSTCGPCVAGNAKFQAVLPTIDNYTVVKYQMSWPGSGDPYYNAQGGLARRQFYSVNSVPRMEIDGQWDQNASSFTRSIFQTYNGVEAHLELTINEATYNPTTKEISVDVDVVSDEDYGSGYTLMMAVVENLTTGNVGSNGETEFHYVFMGNVPDQNGIALTGGLTKNVPQNFKESRNFSSSFIEEFSDLKLVVWVDELATKETQNSQWAEIRDAAVIGLDEKSQVKELSIYPNPTMDQSTVRFDLEESANIVINVVDITGKTVQTVANTTYNAGSNKVVIDGTNLSGGLYYVSIITDNDVITRKLMLNK
jgi:hypothetical protein